MPVVRTAVARREQRALAAAAWVSTAASSPGGMTGWQLDLIQTLDVLGNGLTILRC